MLCPIRLFDHEYHDKTVLPELEAEIAPDFRVVDGQKGITVSCGDIECVFEFIAYQYTGETTKEERQGTTILADENEATYDNDGTSNQVSRSPSVPVNARHSENDQEDSSLFSPPLVHPQLSELQVGGVYDFSQQRAPSLQRSNTVDVVPRPRDMTEMHGGHHSRVTKMVEDFSPRGREMRMRLKSSKRSTLTKSVSLAGSSDQSDNQQATESAANRSGGTADSDQPLEPDNDKATTSSASDLPLAGAIAGDASLHQQARPSSMHQEQLADTNRSSFAQSHTQRMGSSSSSHPLLSSIEESSDANESASSPPVFSDH